MQTTESLKRRIKSAGDLLSVVKTMKALAAVSIRQYQKAVESLEDYNRAVEMGLQIVLKERMGAMMQSKDAVVKRMGAIVFGSDQGLCGQLNEQISVFALDNIKEAGVKKKTARCWRWVRAWPIMLRMPDNLSMNYWRLPVPRRA